MKALLLAARYTTRLYPLTENFPKPLLPVAGQPILSHLFRKLERVDEVDEACRDQCSLFEHFRTWADNERTRLKITVLNDGTSNENRLSAPSETSLLRWRTAGFADTTSLCWPVTICSTLSLPISSLATRERPDARAMVTVHVLEETERQAYGSRHRQ